MCKIFSAVRCFVKTLSYVNELNCRAVKCFSSSLTLSPWPLLWDVICSLIGYLVRSVVVDHGERC